MSDSKRVRHFVRNQQNQPVELYLPTGLIVLGPREEAEVGELDILAPQFRALQKTRLVTSREAVDTPEAPAASSKARQKPTKTREQEGGTN